MDQTSDDNLGIDIINDKQNPYVHQRKIYRKSEFVCFSKGLYIPVRAWAQYQVYN